MVLILDGNRKMGAHVWSDTGYLICLRPSRAADFQKRSIFRHTGSTRSELPTIIPCSALHVKHVLFPYWTYLPLDQRVVKGNILPRRAEAGHS